MGKRKAKDRKLGELALTVIDWKKYRLLREWRLILDKTRGAARWHRHCVLRSAFGAYVGAVRLQKSERRRMRDASLERRCLQFVATTRRRTALRRWMAATTERLRERERFADSAAYHRHCVASKVFAEWKLFVRTARFKTKLMAKSVTSLRGSILSRSRNNLGRSGVLQ